MEQFAKLVCSWLNQHAPLSLGNSWTYKLGKTYAKICSSQMNGKILCAEYFIDAGGNMYPSASWSAPNKRYTWYYAQYEKMLIYGCASIYYKS